MRLRSPPPPAAIALVAGLLAVTASLTPEPARAQDAGERHPIWLEATPTSALGPLAMPMPASRNHNYWGLRVQSGLRRGRDGPDLRAIAAGIDLQWRGGSVFGMTAGYQERDCELSGPDCGAHSMFGARARFNVVSGGPTIASLIGDYSATTTLGAEIGLGYGRNVLPGQHACTVDLGVPISIAMLQTVRVVTFVSPGVMWEADCSDRDVASPSIFLWSFGIGLQQLLHRGLDVYIGWQKLSKSGTGNQFGVGITYVRLPQLAAPR